MTRRVRHFFAQGHTARGAHYVYHSAFQGLTNLFMLLGPPGIGKSTVIQRVADTLIHQGIAVELFHSPLYPDELDALIIPGLKAGIADAQACEGIRAAGGIETVNIPFDNAVDNQQLTGQTCEEIASLQEQLNSAYGKAYDSFAAALRIHDDWEKLYIDNMDFHKADQVIQELLDTIFGSQVADKKAVVRHLFLGAATPRGAVDHIPSLTAGLEKRIFVKGRAGTGKSTMLKRLAAAAETGGFDVEVFHCGFDPQSLDMLIFPELSLAIFDSTAPHEHFPDRDGDHILDMYERVVQPGIDERYAVELDSIKKQYTHKMKEAISYLREASELDSSMKAFYKEATDFAHVNHLYDQLQHAISELTIQSQFLSR